MGNCPSCPPISYVPGRRRLYNYKAVNERPKTGWESSNVKGTICPPLVEIGSTYLPKPGWAIAHSAHPSPTFLDVVGFTYEAVNERMLVKILRATQHITVGQYFDFVQHSPPICTVWTVNDVLVDPYPFHAGIDQAVHVPLYLLNFCPMKNQIKSFFFTASPCGLIHCITQYYAQQGIF